MTKSIFLKCLFLNASLLCFIVLGLNGVQKHTCKNTLDLTCFGICNKVLLQCHAF
ncbi:hypothetical protein HCCG_01858 [Helicobacter cinaedi CCUG 18818 = ATCC BAA-847]|uniref:Uncharacterized protein n=1 Tax=Helicobacter cinaedi CCUG 18818 = ATCC BAA-847 TaxID=537971 RepID=A0ABN0BCH3_9HELI|nr:hypothetical protein HCCG_01858 [Helicobacter cinaedi CCUG 18818 = ATCC BAA-847]